MSTVRSRDTYSNRISKKLELQLNEIFFIVIYNGGYFIVMDTMNFLRLRAVRCLT